MKEQWYSYMEAISLGHDDAFIKAGILPDYAKDESEDIPGTKSSEEDEHEGAGPSKEGEKPHENPSKEMQGAEAEGVRTAASAIDTVTREEASAGKSLYVVTKATHTASPNY